jgi:hypothetical protein
MHLFVQKVAPRTCLPGGILDPPPGIGASEYHSVCLTAAFHQILAPAWFHNQRYPGIACDHRSVQLCWKSGPWTCPFCPRSGPSDLPPAGNPGPLLRVWRFRIPFCMSDCSLPSNIGPRVVPHPEIFPRRLRPPLGVVMLKIGLL